jgi:4-aminobutyrate aminotransferase
LLPSVYQVPYPSCYRCPFQQTQGRCDLPCLDYLRDFLERVIYPEEVAAMIIEPVMGEGGYAPAPRDFLRELRTLCTQHGIQLIFDEVQSGMGRTGQWFAAQHYGVSPDILTVAKGIASGFPLSAVVAGKEVMSRWEPGAHGTTFGGNPVSCAAAAATIAVIEDDGLLQKVRTAGETVLSRLRTIAADCQEIGDVRGFGFMIGVEFVTKDGAPDGSACRKLLDFCLRNGLILIECGPKRNVVRFVPPLIVSDSDLDRALDIFGEGVRSLR